MQSPPSQANLAINNINGGGSDDPLFRGLGCHCICRHRFYRRKAYGYADKETYPSRPVHIFVPYPPGGAVDIVARTLGDALSRRWGQTVVIENRPGAGGVIAEQALVQSPPDGYTLILVASGHSLLGHFYNNLPYDTFKDFTPISLVGSSPNILLVAPLRRSKRSAT